MHGTDNSPPEDRGHQPNTNPSRSEQIALDLIRRGIAPVPVPRGKKNPTRKKWQDLRISVADVARYFGTDDPNVGALMGPASHGLTDADLDCTEAIKLAPHFLPRTNSVYGRASKKQSHRLYTCDDPDDKAFIKLVDETGACIVELRLGGGGKGAQSVMPGSTHESGETYEWDADGERATATCTALKAGAVRIAVGTILIRHWPARGSRHDAALTIGGFLARAGWSADDIEHFVTVICQVHGGHDSDEAGGKTARDSAERHAAGGTVYGMPQMIEIFGEPAMKHIAKLLKLRGDTAAPEAPETSDDGLPTAQFGHLSKMADRTEEILIEAKVPFYQRGSTLVRPVILPAKTFHGKDTTAAQLVEIDLPYMRDTMCKKSRWIKLDKRSRSWIDIHPPAEAATVLLSRFGDWKFPSIAGIISTPTLRPDGTILSAAGYDPETQLLLVDPPKMDPIPERPTMEDALASLLLLNDLLKEFPFDSPVSKSGALSGTVSTVCRGICPIVPVLGTDAPDSGVGKSYLLTLISRIATGRDMPVIGTGKNEEEMEKRVSAALIQGHSLVCLDNATEPLGGDALCRLTEQTRPLLRVLGFSEMKEVLARSATFFVNGVNLTVFGQMIRRVILSRLDPKMENPELRKFTGDPVKTVMEDRGKYIAACLTVVRAYIMAGQPNKLTPLASYGEWSDTVRSALVWLGEEDPVKSMETSRAEDPEKSALITMMSGWVRVFRTGSANGTSLQNVIDHAGAISSITPGTNVPVYAHPELRTAVQAVMPPHQRHQLSVENLGYWMRKMKGRRVGGMWFCRAHTNRSEPAKWWVELEGAAGGGQGAADRGSIEVPF